jgi:alkylation response protein AidB-like acyl-CoA dehydrogenase
LDTLTHTHTDGFDRRLLNIRAHGVSGTAYLDFENVKVPVSARIGDENKGFKYTMFNFNHERFYLCCITNRMARVCVEECIRYSINRKAFGKSLADQQSIRLKIAEMLRLVEGFQAWLEHLAYQMSTMSQKEANLKLGDLTCSLKAQCNVVYERVAMETTHVFGGNALMKGGGGHRIEHALAQSKSYSIPAGARDVMDDYAARSAIKFAKIACKL